MQNFGETITYWYLRLNGFFPLTDFVTHRYNGINNADTDLLALRLPDTYEAIGGLAEDLDSRFQTPWGQGGMQLPGLTAGLIVQVKTGAISHGDLGDALSRAFRPERIIMSVQRLGILHPEEAARWGRELADRPSFVEFCLSPLGQERHPDHRGIVAKVLVTEEERVANPAYFSWDLVQMTEFIVRRFERLQEKDGGRLFFPSDLVQYLSWVGKRRRRRGLRTL